MTTLLLEARPELMERSADLQSQVAVMQEKIQVLLRGVGGLQVILPELHDETSGRIDAQKLATFMGVPLKRLAEGLGPFADNPAFQAFLELKRAAKLGVRDDGAVDRQRDRGGNGEVSAHDDAPASLLEQP